MYSENLLVFTFTAWHCSRFLRSNWPPNPSTQTTALGSGRASVAFFPVEAITCSYKTPTVDWQKSTHASRERAQIPSPRRCHRHNHHISVISLSVLGNRCPALTTNPISKKKSSSRPSRPNCPLNNILNQRRKNMTTTATCGGFCFRAARGSGSSTSGGYDRTTLLAVVMIMRFVCLG